MRINILVLIFYLFLTNSLFADNCRNSENCAPALNCVRCEQQDFNKVGTESSIIVMSPRSTPLNVPVPVGHPAYTACVPCGCGDGIKEDIEACEDGNGNNLDGCDVFCRVEYCGDGMRNNLVAGQEQCDDANSSPNDGCINCRNAACGDGHIWYGVEACDDANTSPNDGCISCVAARCGDGHIYHGVEQCEGDYYCSNCMCTGAQAAPACDYGAVCEVYNTCGQCVSWRCNTPPPPPPPPPDPCANAEPYPGTICRKKSTGNKYAPDCHSGSNSCCFNWVCENRDCNNCGCFPYGRKLLMADGSEQSVEDVKVGDYLASPSGVPTKILRLIEGPEYLPLIEFGAGGRVAQVTTEHVVPTKSGLKKASELIIGDIVTDVEKRELTIDHLKQLPLKDGERVINFVLESEAGSVDRHLLISDGLVTGDLYLQENLDKIR